MNSLLLVDDERWVRTALRHTIDRLNKPVRIVQECSHGLEALDWLKENKVDLILSDIRMPVMDGLTFVREVRRLNVEQDIVLITVHNDFEHVQQAIRSGVFDYITKPVEDEELAICLDKWLEKKGRQMLQPPGQPEHQVLTTVGQVLRYIQNTPPGDVTLAEAARQVHMNPSYLSQLFKHEMQINFVDYVTGLRMAEAKRLLTATTLRISEIACRLGYNDIAYFSNMFRRTTDTSPTEYRKNMEKHNQDKKGG